MADLTSVFNGNFKPCPGDMGNLVGRQKVLLHQVTQQAGSAACRQSGACVYVCRCPVSWATHIRIWALQ